MLFTHCLVFANYKDPCKRCVLALVKTLCISSIYQQVEDLKKKLETCRVPEDIKGTDESCKKFYDIMRRFPERPEPYPNVLELTDKGPGAGVHNLEVQDLFLLVCQLFESDHRIRLHRAPHDSVQNEAERTNAAIGEALTTGSLVAPPNDPFHGLPTAEFERMCLKDTTFPGRKQILGQWPTKLHSAFTTNRVLKRMTS